MVYVYPDAQIVIKYDEVNHRVQSISLDGGGFKEIYSPDGKNVSFDDLTQDDISTIGLAFNVLAKIGTGIESNGDGRIVITLDYSEDIIASIQFK